MRNRMFDSPSAKNKAKKAHKVLCLTQRSQGHRIRMYVNTEVFKNVLLLASHVRTWHGVRDSGTK